MDLDNAAISSSEIILNFFFFSKGAEAEKTIEAEAEAEAEAEEILLNNSDTNESTNSTNSNNRNIFTSFSYNIDDSIPISKLDSDKIPQ